MEDLVEKAKDLCTKIHKNALYYLKGEAIPYYNHCYIVANIVRENAENDLDKNYAMILAYLHDSIEDTEITYEYLVNNFNTKIADGVLALSKNPNLPHDERLSDSIKRIKLQSKEVAAVKMADRICNLMEIQSRWNKEKCLEYLEEAKQIYNELGYASINIKTILKKSIEDYVIKIENKL